jgi:hypothetical protein
MIFTRDLKKIGVYRVVAAQIVLTLVAGVVAYYIYDSWFAAGSALYGGTIVIASSWWMANRIRRASEFLSQSIDGEVSTRGAVLLYAGLFQRLIFTVIVFALGIGQFHLPALPMIAGFAVAHAGYFFVGRL